MRINHLFSLLFILLSGTELFAQWGIDPDRSQVGFKIDHLLVNTVHGKFNTFVSEINYDEKNKQITHLTGELNVYSIDTSNEMRDEELRTEKIFNPINFPKIKFVMTSFKNGKVIGDLTIKNITKQIELKAVIGDISRDKRRLRKFDFDLFGEINRHDFGLTWNKAIELTAGLSNTVAIELLFEVIDEE